MDWQRIVRDRLTELGLTHSREDGIVEEIAQHLEVLCEDERNAGASADQARATALAQLEDPSQVATLLAALRSLDVSPLQALGGPQGGRPHALVEGTPATGGILRDAGSDIRFGLRALVRRPLFATVAIVTLALGIGANTAIFSLVDAVLLRPLPYRDPGRLVHFFETRPSQDFGRHEASYPDFLDLQRGGGPSFESVVGYDGGSVSFSRGDEPPERIPVLQVTDGFFQMLGVEAARGRVFLPGESGVDGAPVALLTDGSWRRRFGADPSVVGETIRLSGRAYTVVGILPRSFQFPLRGTAEICLPLSVSAQTAAQRSRFWLDVIARLRPGVSVASASEQLEHVMADIRRVDPEWHGDVGVSLVPLRDEMTRGVRPAMWTTLAAVALLLLVACSNLATLLLARATEREREFALRGALGARPGRLLRHLLAESLLLSLIGGTLGLAVAFAGARLAVTALPERAVATLPHLSAFSLHLPALLFTFGTVLATTVLFGLAPALRAARTQPVVALQGSRIASPHARGRLGKVLVVGEIAATLMLLLAAGWVGKSLARLLATSPGFRAENLLSMRLSPPIGWNGEADETLRLYRELLGRLSSLPGVSGVATVSQLPLTGRGDTGNPRLETRPDESAFEVNVRGVSPSYFDVLGIPLLAGREFGADDRPGAPFVVMVNRTFARRAFPGGDAVGRRLSFAFVPDEPWMEIVGVVGDEKVDTLDQEVTPIVYFDAAQGPDPSYSVLVRSPSDPERLARAITAEIHAIDPQWPVYAVRTLSQVIADSPPVFLRRYLSVLISVFALVAAMVATVGVYGIVAFSVAQRQREIGVRVSLGATRGDIVRLVVDGGLRLAALGIALGLLAGALLARVAASLLYGVSAGDPLVLVGAAAIVLTAALAACAVPALRAVRVDPVEALRAE